jgi:hypothetical protein
MHCMLSYKSEPVAKLRLDTLALKLTCATCLHKDLIRVNMVGRVTRFRKQHFYLCPSCVSIQEYKGDPTEQIWPTEALDGSISTCSHRPAPRQSATSRRRQPCAICSEPASGHTVERVDHLTGEMRLFHYCQRHAPRYDAVAKCVNARQLEGC